ncbi:MAG: flagellar motor protein MotB [Bacteroidales bacterium]|nr:flagellar motor protein MotB [Bacteroidales bacterium]
MKTKGILLILAVSLLSMTGCVTHKKYNLLQADYNASQVALAESRSDAANLKSQLESCGAANRELKSQYDTLQRTLYQSVLASQSGNVNISKLVDQINESNGYIRRLVEAKSKSDSLLMVLSNNLTRSLDTNELKDVDVKVLKGVVYISLADNMLFRSGSYEISPNAMDILSKIAKIIKDYKNYSVLVEGNTDNVPINRTNIRNNWDLSALRASSVVQVLQNRFDVDPSRLTAGGRGEYNPVATNDTPEGRQLNRRTQIIITPSLDQFMDLIDKAPDTDSSDVR